MAQTIWIARHGNRLDFVNPAWFNTAERRYDPPLSEDGVVQAKQLAKRLKSSNIAHIFASPFLRTVQTAYEVAKELDLPIKLEAGLSEWLNPDWMTEMPKKLPPEVLAQKYPCIDLSYQSHFNPQYPESSAKLKMRNTVVARRLVREYTEDILLVGHGAIVKGATAALVGGKPEVNASLCCVVKLVKNGEGWDMELNGDTSHLSEVEENIRFN